MRKLRVILDFNDPTLKLRLSNVDLYDIDTIYKNIEQFNKIAQQFKVNKDFARLINTPLFQSMLVSDTTNNIDDLLRVYNSLASGMFGEEFKSTLISKNQFKENLRYMGYGVDKNRVIAPMGTLW